MIERVPISNIHFETQPDFRWTLTKSAISFLFLFILLGCSRTNPDLKLDVHFRDGYGQVEIGGKYVGAEFHKSRPLPSRLSYYYPVANSIDLSTDYWERHKSHPYTILLTSEGKTDTIGRVPYSYNSTPFNAQFENSENNYKITFSYDVCDDLPVLVLKMSIRNISNQNRDISLETSLQTSLHTSHTYTLRNTASLQYINSTIAMAAFNNVDTDSAVFFIANAGEIPVNNFGVSTQFARDPKLQFTYQKNLNAGDHIEIIQLLGMCRQKESKQIISNSLQQWEKSVSRNNELIQNYALNQTLFSIGDLDLVQTANWSKALLASNIHYINGQYMPMPCPAEYNFFFTHDLLLTNLGAMYFDLDYAKKGFQLLHSLTKDDSVLAHAYYWKDTQFVTEYCNFDNWNHMWFIIAASSYLKHSADFETLNLIFSMLKKSLQMILQSKGDDDLMYSKRPDWWDIGNVYGARVYNTTLMYKTLQDFVYIASQLDKKDEPLVNYLQLAGRMKNQFVEKFWDKKSDFLFSMINNETVDHHFYSGSLVAAFFDLLDNDKTFRLLKTVKDTLLDENIGIRNAMPPDFQEWIQVYKFNGMEAGEPYFYFNGAVWPQGNIWYALALLSNNQVDEAKNVIKKYLSLNGIRNSPNGQPSFYETRISNSESPRYGEIDKPTFLWAGGWYLHTLYQLAGLRENSWNIFFHPSLPQGFENAEYDFTLFGKLCRTRWRGQGNYFHQIEIDGQIQYSAVITSPATRINLERGKPETPYLAEANCTINNVIFQALGKKFSVEFSGIVDQIVSLVVISPTPLQKSELNGSDFFDVLDEMKSRGIYTYTLKIKTTKKMNELVLHLK
jgi:hypothetical protein